MSYAHPRHARAPERQTSLSHPMTRAAERQSTRVGCWVGTNFSHMAMHGDATRRAARLGDVWQTKDEAGACLTQVHHYFEGARA